MVDVPGFVRLKKKPENRSGGSGVEFCSMKTGNWRTEWTNGRNTRLNRVSKHLTVNCFKIFLTTTDWLDSRKNCLKVVAQRLSNNFQTTLEQLQTTSTFARIIFPTFENPRRT